MRIVRKCHFFQPVTPPLIDASLTPLENYPLSFLRFGIGASSCKPVINIVPDKSAAFLMEIREMHSIPLEYYIFLAWCGIFIIILLVMRKFCMK